jgi:choline dehydrogenase
VTRLHSQSLLSIDSISTVPRLEPFRRALSKGWVSKGKRLAEDIYSGEVNGLVKCMNTTYQGVHSNSSVFLQGKLNIALVFRTQEKSILIDGTSATGVVVVNDNGK